MANRITINFAAKGHKGVTAAVKALNQQVDRLSVAQHLLGGSSKKLTKDQQRVANAFATSGAAAAASGNAFSVLRSKMLLASFAGTVVAGSLLKITNAAGDAAEQMSKASVVFGVSFSNMEKFAEQLGNTINRSTFDLMEMAASVQDILVPMGIARVRAAELSKSIVTLAADVGSFSNVASADVMRDFNSAMVGNHETVRKYGIVISETRMKQVALEEGIIKAGEALSDQDKILVRLAIIQRDSTDAIGDAERTANSYANVMQGLSAQFHESSVVIGNVFLPVVTAVAKTLTLLLKVMQRPTAIIAMTVAFAALARKIVFTDAAMKKLSLSTSVAIAKMRALKISLGAIGIAMLALEVVFSMWDTFFPDRTAERIEENAEKVRLKLLGISEEIDDMSLEELGSRTMAASKNLENQREVLDRLKAQLASSQLELKNFGAGLKDTGLTSVDLRAEIKNLTNMIKIQQGVVKGAAEEFKLYEETQDNLNTTNQSLFKFQKKYTDEIRSTITEVAKLAVANNDLKSLQVINADAAMMFALAMKKVGMSVSEAQAETIKFLEMDQLSQSAFGKPFKDLDEDTKNLLTTFKDLQDVVAFQKIMEGLQDQKQALRGTSEAQVIANKAAEQGIKISKDQVEQIQKEIDIIKNLEAEKRAQQKIPKLETAVQELETKVQDGQLVDTEKNTQDILDSFKDRHSQIETFEKLHNDRIKDLTEKGLLDTYTMRFQNEQKLLEAKKELGEEELDFLLDLEQRKDAIKQLSIDMAFDTISQLTNMMQSNLDEQLNAELEALKKSERFRNADAKKKKQLEAEVKKGFQQEQEKIFRINQMANLAQITMNTASAVMEAVKLFPPSGMPWSAIIGALGATQAGIVLAQKPPKLREGGYIGGRSHSAGGTLIEAEKGEFVMRKSAEDSIGLETQTE